MTPIKACVLIPIYNHKDSIRGTVERLSVYRLPILIIDDGSDQATQNVLAELALGNPLIRLARLAQNSGKGAAVMHGLDLAHQAGFSHALQIDADGQHDTGDVPRFLERAAQFPTALICGEPIYDSSVPKGRLYGRYLTHFWVWIETLSFAISDSMCGFRLYPLAATCALLATSSLPTRMDFDIAILVRLAWRGIRFENIATRVIYPKDGVSHFNLLRDNLRITWLHTRLVCGMLLRLPRLLGHKIVRHSTRNSHWAKIGERGSALGLRILVMGYRLGGRRAARMLLYPIIAYFLFTGRQARQASLSYLKRVHAYHPSALPKQPGWRDSFRHMLAFAESGLDKLATWANPTQVHQIDFPDHPAFEQLLATQRGAILIGSHLGNLELTRALANHQKNTTINAVVYTDHAQRFNAMLADMNADFAVNLIQVTRWGPDIAILLKDKIERGELVVIVGDRTPPNEDSQHVSSVEFLGEPAPFAHGPLILASLLDCPVYLFFCLRTSDGYQIHFEPFAEKIVLPRRERHEHLQKYLQQYARRLEAYCLTAPYQWFNFYDFWRTDHTTNHTHSITKI